MGAGGLYTTMSLFQKTVFKEFVASQNQNAIQEAFEKYQAHFANPDIKANIHTAKEEQYQEGFLQDLFVKVLGYTLYPQANHNLITEQKTATSAKKSDAAILQNGKVIAIIELKSTRVFDLRNIEGQAFAYKNAQPDCRYVITSNFAKMRFYLDNTLFYEEFDLFEMTLERFAQLYTILQVENMLSDLPLELKARSMQKQEEITVAFYNDYQAFKEVLFTNIYVLNKSKYDELLLFGKTQKLIDRLIFLCFASDKTFLPVNLVDTIIQEWENLNDIGIDTSLYDRFQAHFEFINSGFSSRKYNIYGFNGGLFAKDEVLDNIQIGDNVLKVHAEKIAFYNFDADVDVNVLGHIFEYSLHQLDQKRQEIIENAKKQDKANAENVFAVRKVEGIFYTPIYVINYIIEETLGKFCQEKKAELGLGFAEIDFTDQSQKDKIAQKLKEYETWLEELSVLDPACGSGAFLNQVLSFFMQEYSWLESLKSGVLPPKPAPKKDTTKYDIFNPAPLPKPKPQEQDIVHKIMENNVFGVDINFESVAITQLSLWLRMAQGKRKLNNMTAHIKEGNSLIDDKKVASNAFEWAKEFPKVFKNKKSKGFRLIVGNPPWGAYLKEKEWLKKQYEKTSFGEINSYKYFIELAFRLMQKNGYLGFVLPDSYIEKEYFADVRKLVSENSHHIKNLRIGDDIFNEVNMPSSILLTNTKKTEEQTFEFADISKEKLENRILLLTKKREEIIFQEQKPDIEKSFIVKDCYFRKGTYIPLIDLYEQVMGIKVYQTGKGKPKQTGKELEENAFITDKKIDKNYYKFIAQGIHKYHYEDKNEFVKYGEWLAEPREFRFFDVPKIVIREVMNNYVYATLIKETAVVKNIAGVIIQKDKNYSLEYLLALLCSKLFAYCIKEEAPKSSNKAFPSVNSKLIKNLPIKELSLKKQQPFIDLVSILLAKNEELHQTTQSFIDFLKAKYQKEKLTKNLEKYYFLENDHFLAEINKAKIKISLKEEKKLWETFIEEKKKAMAIQEIIQKTEAELDNMVYALYGLGKSEIEIVESVV